MDFKYKIDVATPEDTETLVNFQLAMAKESEGTELDYGTVREGIKEVGCQKFSQFLYS